MNTRAPYQYFFYTPFGETILQEDAFTATYDNPWRFKSEELDQETGLNCYGACYCNPKWSLPALSRVEGWLGVDPLSQLSPDQPPYHFVSNNPVMRINPNGLKDFVNINGDIIGSDGTKEYGKILVLDKAIRKQIRSAKEQGLSYSIKTEESQYLFEVPSPEELADIESKLIPLISENEYAIALAEKKDGGPPVSSDGVLGDRSSVNVGAAHKKNYDNGYVNAIYDGHLYPIGHIVAPSEDPDPVNRKDRESPNGLGLSRPSFILGKQDEFSKVWINFYNSKGTIWQERFDVLKKMSKRIHTAQ